MVSSGRSVLTRSREAVSDGESTVRQLDPTRGARTAMITRHRRPLRTAVIATAAAVALSAVALPAHAAPGDVTVCASGCDYTTIQAAVSAVSAGTVVSVAPGAYTGSVSITKAITLEGAGNGDDPS